MHGLFDDARVGVSRAFAMMRREPVTLHLRVDQLHCCLLLVVLAEETSEVRAAIAPEVNAPPVWLQVLAKVFLHE